MIRRLFSDKTINKGILSSLIATIFFLYFLEPIFNILSKMFLLFGELISSTFIDGLYQEIAAGKTDYSFSILALMGMIITSLVILLVIKNIHSLMQDTSKIAKPHTKKLTDKKIGKTKKMLIIRVLLPIFLILCLVFFVTMGYIKIQTINNFEQKIKIITPYITDKNKDVLISKFSQMKNKDDYNELSKEIEKLGNSNNIELPDVGFFNLY